MAIHHCVRCESGSLVQLFLRCSVQRQELITIHSNPSLLCEQFLRLCVYVFYVFMCFPLYHRLTSALCFWGYFLFSGEDLEEV